MSLYIGNLSARTRRDELERVFRRFGQCEIRLKDGYGFVVYSFAPQAEKAMKLLQGRLICGQQLNITWSNKQPRPIQRDGRGNRPYEPRRRDFSGRRMLRDYRDYRPGGIKVPDGDGARPDSENVVDEDTDRHREEAMIDNDENHGDGAEILDGGRWGEQVDDPSNDDGVDSDRMTDRYDPYCGNRWRENSSGGSQGIGRREQDSDAVLNVGVNDSKSRINCFNCGELGHKARDCPSKHPSRRKFSRFDRGLDNLFGGARGDRASKSGQLRTVMKYRNSPELDGDVHVGRRSKRESKFSKRRSENKSKRSGSISEYSASSTSRSGTKSLKPRERSRSVARSHSLDSNSRSISKSCYSKSRSRSRSSSPTPLSLSVSPVSKNIHVQQAIPKLGSDRNAISTSKVEDDTSKASREALGRTKPEAQPAAKPSSVAGDSKGISLEEMCVALRHFGAELPDESEKHGSLEAFFGSARLWPWEGIYYRRVRKGPVSVENYARRVAQNREFGIVDKYIRSSSGWGESERYQENP